jgi:hypothetical protein
VKIDSPSFGRPPALTAPDGRRSIAGENITGARTPTLLISPEDSVLRVTRDLMLPTAITGSYPRPLWYDANLSGRSFKAALGDSMFREQYLDAVAAVINAQEAVPAAAAGLRCAGLGT